ncbi:hypothetical protein OXPF_23100 [Oxobacter pfennigii]|uniref:Uracil-DNA glycosylase-like domain-containing protein n=1 Tax=Oxobacter pfennigii TaxID=36849 RepID=A0A0P8W622_9CLOT|nr:uracil-DNA glycosylase family protein [Oxobacter pfennigii]KPU44143.1 hypothetical protein OXPF_23100 [Oxobacter pfennigii]
MFRNDLPSLLFEKIYKVEPYPDSVEPVPRMIEETAFFPGGKGLWMENTTNILPSILVLGQDFSALKEYLKIVNSKSKDLECPTWRNIIKLFKEADISLSECFFSNVFMGLRKTESMVGKFPGFKDKEFTQRNLEFLAFQIEIIKPKLIITLGRYAINMLANLSSQTLKSWKKAKSFNDIDEAIKFDVEFRNHRCNCVSLVHPCMRHSNIKRRRYNNYMGNHAELNMLRDALNQ